MMKKIVIISAAVLAIGAISMGVVAGTVSAEKPDTNVDHMSVFSDDEAQTVENLRASDVNSQASSHNTFIDHNNDGICDNYADGACPQNGTGNGNRCGNSNYIDENNDGICDNYADGACPQNGTGNGHHYRSGTGNGAHHGNGCGRR